MRKLLVTGASGFLGWNVCGVAARRWDVTGIYCRHPVAREGVTFVQADLTESNVAAEVLDVIRPDAILHAAAVAFPNDCEKNPEASFAINVEASELLARVCADRDLPFVFVSTDLVFDGLQPPYREEAPLAPVNLYGRQKQEAELRVAAVHPKATICRMPLMFGDPGPFAETFIQGNLQAFAAGRSQNLFTDEFRTPVGGRAAAEGLLMVLEKQISGLLHLGGVERVSRYAFGLLLADVFGYSADLVRPVKQAEIHMAAARPPDVSLDSSRAFSMGYGPGSLRDQLELLSP